jgi:hypothetical protein
MNLPIKRVELVRKYRDAGLFSSQRIWRILRRASMLGAAGESLGMDRHLKVNTAKHRTHSLFRQGLRAL